MKARDHTTRMLDWWRAVGVDRLDLALRRRGGAWLWHRQRTRAQVDQLLPWARAENLHEAEVYARPARGACWPLLFLDDLREPDARALAAQQPALSVKTSNEGGCQLWLLTAEPLDEGQRYRAQKQLAKRFGGDLGSISGEHLGRLAGFRNWKRGGQWVNVLAATSRGRALTLSSNEDEGQAACEEPTARLTRHGEGTDASESGREWGWVLGALESGLEAAEVYGRLLERARKRRGRNAERYARRTVSRALKHLRS